MDTKAKTNKYSPNYIHFVGNAHIDPVWLWRWQEGYQETRATFRSALDRMNEFPDFVFTASQAAIYQWIEESDPQMFAEITRRVKEGRWAVVNGWWMEPDCNIPGGESFARQSLYGQRYFFQKFGKSCLSGYCVDSFGHHGMLPQLLSEGGFKYYVFMRPNNIENSQCPNGPFWWESPDGNRILAYRLLSAYGSGPEDLTPESVRKISSYFDENVRDEMFFFGVGDHGGGPTIMNIRSIIEMQKDKSLPRLLFSSPDQYFKNLIQNLPGDDGASLPVYRGELQMHAVGCYAAHSGVKKWNRKAEHELIRAERWTTISHSLLGTAYPKDEFTRAWQMVLFNQFHDILAGSSIKEAYTDSRDAFGFALYAASSMENGALQRLGGRIDTRGGETAIVVFNPHSFEMTMPVEHELMTWHLGNQPLALTDELGKMVTWQEGPISATVPPGWRKRICFLAEVPACGYRVYFLNGGTSDEAEHEITLAFDALPFDVVNGYDTQADGKNDIAIENACFRLVIDSRLGDVKQWIDKKTGHEVFSGHACVGIVLDDPSDTWSHGLTAYRNNCGRFSMARVKVIENGPERIIVRASSTYENSKLDQDFIVYKDLPWVEVRVKVDWHEQLQLLKMAFPVKVQNPVATYEIPYGVIERPADGREVPGQRWFDVTGEMDGDLFGLSIINDCKYSFDVLASEMRMTVLRSPVYAHHTPQKLNESKEYEFMDQGRQDFTYLIYPHAGSGQDSEAVHLAEFLNMPPVALTESIHAGDFPAAQGFLSVTGKNVVICALKMAEDGDDLILRVRETAGEQTTVHITMPFIQREIDADLTPWKVKTFRIPIDPKKPIQVSNFIEA